MSADDFAARNPFARGSRRGRGHRAGVAFRVVAVCSLCRRVHVRSDSPLAERRARRSLLIRICWLAAGTRTRELRTRTRSLRSEVSSRGLLAERFRATLTGPRPAGASRRLNDTEASARGIAPPGCTPWSVSGEAILVRAAGESRWIAAEDADRYRAALGTSLPVASGGLSYPGPRPSNRWQGGGRAPRPVRHIRPRGSVGLAAAAVEEALTQLARGAR